MSSLQKVINTVHEHFHLESCNIYIKYSLIHWFLAYLTLYVIILYTLLRGFYHFGVKTFKFWKCCYQVHHTCVTAVCLGSPFRDAQIAKSEADTQGLFRALLLWDVGPLLPSAAPWGNCTHFFFFFLMTKMANTVLCPPVFPVLFC